MSFKPFNYSILNIKNSNYINNYPFILNNWIDSNLLNSMLLSENINAIDYLFSNPNLIHDNSIFENTNPKTYSNLFESFTTNDWWGNNSILKIKIKLLTTNNNTLPQYWEEICATYITDEYFIILINNPTKIKWDILCKK